MLFLEPKKATESHYVSSKNLAKGFCKCRLDNTKLLKQYYYNIWVQTLLKWQS